MQEPSGWSMANAVKTISCKAWNSAVENHSGDCKHDIKGFEDNIFNPIFKDNVQGWKHPGSWAFTEPELLRHRKPKPVVQTEKIGHNNSNESHNYDDENHNEINLYQGNI